MSHLRRGMALLYLGLCLLCGLVYARLDYYQMDGDAVSFLDIADAMHAHRFDIVLNSYWNPGYPALLAIAQAIAHPSRLQEMQVYVYVNFLIFAACLGATLFLVRGLVALQRRFNPRGLEEAALSPLALGYLGVGLLLLSFQREIRIGAIRSDPLLLFFLLMAAAFLLRLQAASRLWPAAGLGLSLGLAYLTKSFAFLPSAFLFLGLFVFAFTRRGPDRRRLILATALASLVFAVVAGPYIVGISRQMGHPTTGESARLNYCFFIDETGRWHEWQHHELGHAAGTFVHPEVTLLGSPPVYSYRNHAVGTFPLWFDPAFFTKGIQPRFWLSGHLRRLFRCTELLSLWIVDHLEGLLLLGVLLAAGALFWRDRRQMLPWLVVPLWGLLMLGIYFPIDIQQRYLTAMLLLILLPLFAALRQGSSGTLRPVANAAAVFLALLALASGFQDLLHMRRSLHLIGRQTGLYSPDIYGAAAGLTALGLNPGEGVACMGSQACYPDPYWARLAGVQIQSEIEVPEGLSPALAWDAFPNKDAILNAIRAQGIRVIVTALPVNAHIPAGWKQLNGTVFFAYDLSAPH